MKEAKEIAAAVVGPPPDNALDIGKIIAAVVTVDDVNLKIAKEVCAVVCTMQEGFVCVAFC